MAACLSKTSGLCQTRRGPKMNCKGLVSHLDPLQAQQPKHEKTRSRVPGRGLSRQTPTGLSGAKLAMDRYVQSL